MSTPKSELLALVQQQPEDSTIEDIVHELTIHVMARRGPTDKDRGDGESGKEPRPRTKTQ
ncbi:MAG: hypothetical protein AAF229_14655 [Pseudomonadota bacterium]